MGAELGGGGQGLALWEQSPLKQWEHGQQGARTTLRSGQEASLHGVMCLRAKGHSSPEPLHSGAQCAAWSTSQERRHHLEAPGPAL